VADYIDDDFSRCEVALFRVLCKPAEHEQRHFSEAFYFLEDADVDLFEDLVLEVWVDAVQDVRVFLRAI